MQPFSEHITFIGTEDDNLDLFEAQYPIPNGISYNSYYIDDEHPAIIDAVDIRRCSDWITNLQAVIDRTGRQPEYIIVQHCEPDHAGSLGVLMKVYPDLKVVCTRQASGMLKAYFEDVDFGSNVQIVKDGDTLCLGRTTLRFVTAPMVHWPEVMMTIDETDQVIFSADAFGSFAMSTDKGPWDNEARRYYTNIVGRYGPSVQSVMKKLKPYPVKVVAPLHGRALTEDLGHYWNLYDKWSRYEPETEGVLVAYASIYGGTAEAARRIAKMLDADGAGEVVLFDLCRHDVSYAVAEAFRLSRMVLACATYDAGLFPAMSNFLHHLGSKHLCNRRVGLIENGSWAPLAGKLMADQLGHMRQMTVVEPVVTLKGRMHRADIPTLEALSHALLSDAPAPQCDIEA